MVCRFGGVDRTEDRGKEEQKDRTNTQAASDVVRVIHDADHNWIRLREVAWMRKKGEDEV